MASIAQLAVEHFIAAAGFGRFQKRRRVTSPAEVTATAGTLSRIVTAAMGITHIGIAVVIRTEAWLCHTLVTDFALVARTSLRIASGFESPKP